MQSDLPRFEMPDPDMIDRYRQMTTTERLAVANRLWVSARRALTCLLTAEHPDWTAEEVRRETARRMLGGRF